MERAQRDKIETDLGSHKVGRLHNIAFLFETALYWWQPESQRLKHKVRGARKRLKRWGCFASFCGFLGLAKSNLESVEFAQPFEARSQPFRRSLDTSHCPVFDHG